MIGKAGMIYMINYPVYHAGFADHAYPVPFFPHSTTCLGLPKNQSLAVC
jgi:hypothetical protein